MTSLGLSINLICLFMIFLYIFFIVRNTLKLNKRILKITDKINNSLAQSYITHRN